MNELVPVSRARKALAEMTSPVEVKDYLDKAVAIREYAARKTGAMDVANDAAEIVVLCRRRLGELFANLPRQRGRRTDLTSAPHGTQVQDTVAEIGVTSKTVKHWQQEARIPEKKVAAWVAGTRESGGQITVAGLRGLIKREARKRAQSPIAGDDT
jgi:hypothetical protein